MNYEANTIQWAKGDIVIHDADAKEPKMLMVVIGYTRDGLCKTQYCNKSRRPTIWTNPITSLHQPERFGIQSAWGEWRQDIQEQVQIDWECCRIWNRRRPVGQRIETTSADGGFITVTTGKAYMCKSGSARVYLEHGGEWLLRFVKAIA